MLEGPFLIADCGLRFADCELRDGSWPLRRSERNRELSRNRLVTCNLSLVTGDLEKLIPSVTLFSISSYQLPATSYKSKRFMVPTRGKKPRRLSMNANQGTIVKNFLKLLTF